MAAKGKTYAEEAKAIMNKYKLRLGDKFDKRDNMSLEAMNQELAALRERQEATREAKLGASDFGKATDGEELQEFHTGGALGHTHAGMDQPFETMSTIGFTPLTGAAPDEGLVGGFDESMVGGQRALNRGTTPFSSRVPWMGAAAGIVGSMIGNRPIDLPEYEYEEFKPERVAPQRVSFARGREQIMRERDVAGARTAGAAKGFGSQSALMEATLAGTTQAQSVAGQQFEASVEQEANINAQMRERASQFNVAQQAQAAQLNMRQGMYAHDVERGNIYQNQRRKDARLEGITGSITGYTKDLIAADKYDQMLQIMAPDNYSFTQGDDSKLRRFLGISGKMQRTFTGTNDEIR